MALDAIDNISPEMVVPYPEDKVDPSTTTAPLLAIEKSGRVPANDFSADFALLISSDTISAATYVGVAGRLS